MVGNSEVLVTFALTGSPTGCFDMAALGDAARVRRGSVAWTRAWVRSTVQVARLPKDALVEIEVVARSWRRGDCNGRVFWLLHFPCGDRLATPRAPRVHRGTSSSQN